MVNGLAAGLRQAAPCRPGVADRGRGIAGRRLDLQPVGAGPDQREAIVAGREAVDGAAAVGDAAAGHHRRSDRPKCRRRRTPAPAGRWRSSTRVMRAPSTGFAVEAVEDVFRTDRRARRPIAGERRLVRRCAEAFDGRSGRPGSHARAAIAADARGRSRVRSGCSRRTCPYRRRSRKRSAPRVSPLLAMIAPATSRSVFGSRLRAGIVEHEQQRLAGMDLGHRRSAMAGASGSFSRRWRATPGAARRRALRGRRRGSETAALLAEKR